MVKIDLDKNQLTKNNISSMSEEELGEFIAALPEDALARVTAILPPENDDELLTE